MLNAVDTRVPVDAHMVEFPVVRGVYCTIASLISQIIYKETWCPRQG